MGPDFLCIGAQKGGTSWLYENMNKLPSFSLLPIKEIHYFDNCPHYPSPKILGETDLIKRVINPKWVIKSTLHLLSLSLQGDFQNLKWFWRWYFSNYTNKWYCSLFENTEGLSGDLTPAYAILSLEDIKIIKETCGDVKIIYMLRNPINRAWSSYKYKYRKTISESHSHIDNVQAITDYIYSNEQTLRGNYIQTIERYLEVFGPGRLIIGFYDAIIDKPKELLRDLVEFIGGNPQEIDTLIDLDQRVNTSASVKMPMILHEELKNLYKPQITELCNRYGGYFEKWNNDIEGIKNPYNYNATIKL